MLWRLLLLLTTLPNEVTKKTLLYCILSKYNMATRKMNEVEPISPNLLDIEFVDGTGMPIQATELSVKPPDAEAKKLVTNEKGKFSSSPKLEGKVEFRIEAS